MNLSKKSLILIISIFAIIFIGWCVGYKNTIANANQVANNQVIQTNPATPASPVLNKDSIQHVIDSVHTNDSLDQMVVNTKNPLTISCPKSLDRPPFSSHALFKLQGKVVQITGYTEQTTNIGLIFATLKEFLNDESGFAFNFTTALSDTSVDKVTIKGIYQIDSSTVTGEFVTYLTNCSLVSNFTLSNTVIEPYLKHPSWATMMRSSDLVYEKVVVRARVIQVVGGNVLASMGTFGNNIFVDNDSYGNDKNIIEGDYIKVVGKFTGTKEYTTVLGAEMSIPEIKPDYITYVGRND
jgi:hypothetical protein